MKKTLLIFSLTSLLLGCAGHKNKEQPIGPQVKKAEKIWKQCIMEETEKFIDATNDLFQSSEAALEQCEPLSKDVIQALKNEGRNYYVIKGYLNALEKDNSAFAKWYGRGIMNGSIKRRSTN